MNVIEISLEKCPIQSLGVTASLLASTLLAMEITVSALTKLGDYPDELLEKVSTTLSY